jgi:hypothetical protein
LQVSDNQNPARGDSPLFHRFRHLLFLTSSKLNLETKKQKTSLNLLKLAPN